MLLESLITPMGILSRLVSSTTLGDSPWIQSIKYLHHSIYLPESTLELIDANTLLSSLAENELFHLSLFRLQAPHPYLSIFG